MINAQLLPTCDRHVRAQSRHTHVDSFPKKSVNDILTPIRQASNYLFVLLPEIHIFLVSLDECALILQPNLKVSVNLFDTQ